MRRVTQRFRAETDGTHRLVRGWLNEGVRMWKKEVQIGWFASTAAWRGREGVGGLLNSEEDGTIY